MANIPTWFKETENILGVPKTKSLNLREDLMSKYSVTFIMLLKHKFLTKIEYCGAKFSHGHDLGAFDPA